MTLLVFTTHLLLGGLLLWMTGWIVEERHRAGARLTGQLRRTRRLHRRPVRPQPPCA